MFIQLWHEGAMREDVAKGPHAGFPTISPSGLVVGGEIRGRAMYPSELDEVKDAYVCSALMAQEAGAVGVEVHGGHGFLIDQFLWSETNRRTDGYGGDEITDRARYPAEIVSAIRKATDPDFLISFRFSQWKELNYHSAKIVNSSEELKLLLNILKDAGVDIFHASTRRFYLPEWEGSDRSLAGWTKALTGAPVITVGGVGVNNDVIECLLEGHAASNDVAGSLEHLVKRMARGEFDLVAVGRASIGDPEWVNKVAAGAYDDIARFDRDALLADMAWDTADAEVAWRKETAV